MAVPSMDDDPHREMRIFLGERPLLAQSGRSYASSIRLPRLETYLAPEPNVLQPS
jgi:hypothetical protein